MKRTVHVILAVLLLAGCSGSKPAPVPPSSAPVTASPAPAPQPDPPKVEIQPEPVLSAGPIRLLARPEKPLWPGPAAVVVENSSQARPQAGLNAADMVVEALAESEISRFLAFYWSHAAEKIGPVRSARSYTVAMSAAYGGPYAHAGGNDDALIMLRDSGGVRNLDEIYGGGGFFWRAADRDPPHNLYTSTKLLDEAVTRRQIPIVEAPTSARTEAKLPMGSELVRRVEVNWHKLHHVAWEWDGNRYLRTEEGSVPHKLEDGAQIAASNLVFLGVEGVNNGWELGWKLDLDRGGKAAVVSGGRSWTGTWSFGAGGFVITPEGKVPPLQPGSVWVHLITDESDYRMIKGE